MLKQAIPSIINSSRFDTAAITGTQSTNPFGNNPLPQWARVNTLARSFPPKPLHKDRVYRTLAADVNNSALNRSELNDFDDDDDDDGVRMSSTVADSRYHKMASGGGGRTDKHCMSADGLGRIEQLEHSIEYLNRQHSHLLSCLHAEIDTLKRENRGSRI